jgi:hypothetical protein
MRFIDDQHVERRRHCFPFLHHGRAAKGLQAADRPKFEVFVLPISTEKVFELLGFENVKTKIKPLLHLHLPLDAERSLANDEGPPEVVRIPGQHFTENETSLNCLPETHLIGKQQSLFPGSEKLQERLELVCLELRPAGT